MKRVAAVAVAAALSLLLIVELPIRYRVYLPFIASGGEMPKPSAQRGAAVPWQYQVCSDVSALDASWWYNWGLHPQGCDAAGFVPMVWCEPGDLSQLPPGEWLLTANEPDNPDQCHRTPEQIAAIWPQLVATGRQLVSPAVLQCEWCTPGYLDDTWLERFMRLVDTGTIDAVAVHYYGCNADRLVAFLDTLWQRYGKPIWLTEWACPRWSKPEQFMRNVIPRLPSYVQRQAWFASRTPDWPWLAPLVDDNGLTELGRTYTGR